MRSSSFVGALALFLVMALSSCSGTASGDTEPPPHTEPPISDSPSIDVIEADRQLYGFIAATKDTHLVARYEWIPKKQDARVITVTTATDGSWSVGVPQWAHDWSIDVTIVGTDQGKFQCVLGKTNSCVLVAKKNASIPKKYDPQVQSIFTQWIDTLLTRNIPISVAVAENPRGVSEDDTCFSLERNSVTIEPPIPPSVMCFNTDGVITAVDSVFGTLRLSGDVTTAPEKIQLPAAVSDDKPLSSAAPPKPSPSPSTKPKDDE